MKNNNLTILKQFNRKLANCRYRISATALADFLAKGKFGYTVGKKGVLVTNEYVFADDIEAVLKHIKHIFNEPFIAIKQENVVQIASSATKTDARSLNETIKDEKLWKVRGDTVKPEYVHAYVNEENLATYENKFICYLVDTLYNEVSAKLSELCGTVKTLNSEMQLINPTTSFSIEDYVNFLDENNGLPVLLSNEDAYVGVVETLVKCKKILTNLKTFELYKACKKAKGVNWAHVQPSNIFENDKHYNYCYLFFKNYFNKDANVPTEEQTYRSFVEVNLFSAIKELGFTPAEENENVSISDSAKIKYDTLSFEKAPFTITLSQKESGVEINVTNIVDGNVAKSIFNVGNNEILQNEEYLNVFNLVAEENGKEKSIVIEPSDANALNILKKIIKSLLFIAEGSEYVHTRYCPICGSSLVSPDGSDYSCINCESIYHIFNYEFKDIIWVKRIKAPIVTEKTAKSEDLMVDSTQESLNFDAINFVSKSFTEKLELSTEEIKEYYNDVKDYILRLNKTRSTVSFSYDNFFVGRKSTAKLAFRGKTLVMYIALQTADYENSKYYPKDFSNVKKYAETPMMVKIKSSRGVKFAKELIDVAFYGLEERKIVETITESNIVEKDKLVIESLEEIAVTEQNFRTGNYISKSFTAKMCQSNEEVKEYYNEVKNYILKLSKTRSTVSFSYDNFFVGRNSTAKLAFRGKTLVMYIALQTADYENSKYYPKDFSEVKKFAETPMMVKIKSSRGVKFAKELIDVAFAGLEEKKNFVEEKYEFPYKTDEQLIEEKLAKKVTN